MSPLSAIGDKGSRQAYALKLNACKSKTSTVTRRERDHIM
jgi:hypothetical protein